MIKSSKQSTIQINGKQYDAKTGRILNDFTSKPKTTTPAQPVARRTSVNAVQDVSRSSTQAVTKKRRPTDRSHTLMRQAVRKPAAKSTIKTVASANATKPQALSPIAKKPVAQNSKTHLTTQQDVARHMRANSIKKSHQISKFNNKMPAQAPVSNMTQPKITSLPVKPAPAKRQQPIQSAPTSQARISSMIEDGMRNAQSHKQERPSNKKSSGRASKLFKKKSFSYGAAALSVLLLTGFFAYQNIPNISMRYASTRSGINASMPKYQPSGFALSNKIEFNPGQVTLNFASNSDERGFSITQRETSWNSDTLLNSYVAEQSDQIQKYEDKGRTIYLYGDNNATWVNGGVWYDINGDSKLNSDQLIRIASSL